MNSEVIMAIDMAKVDTDYVSLVIYEVQEDREGFREFKILHSSVTKVEDNRIGLVSRMNSLVHELTNHYRCRKVVELQQVENKGFSLVQHSIDSHKSMLKCVEQIASSTYNTRTYKENNVYRTNKR